MRGPSPDDPLDDPAAPSWVDDFNRSLVQPTVNAAEGALLALSRQPVPPALGRSHRRRTVIPPLSGKSASAVLPNGVLKYQAECQLQKYGAFVDDTVRICTALRMTV